MVQWDFMEFDDAVFFLVLPSNRSLNPWKFWVIHFFSHSYLTSPRNPDLAGMTPHIWDHITGVFHTGRM